MPWFSVKSETACIFSFKPSFSVETGVVELFDAFVCYSYPDMNFVKQMIQHLEGIHGLKLCIHARDLLPGTSKHTVTAKLIEERYAQ